MRGRYPIPEGPELENIHRHRLALEVGCTERPEVREVAEQLGRSLANDDPAGRSERLESGRQVGGVPDRGEVPQLGASNVANEGRSRVDSDPETGRRRVNPHGGRLDLEAECRSGGAYRMIGLAD